MLASVSREKRMMGTIEHMFPVPDHIEQAVSALKSDLFNGPTICLIPNGDVTQFNGDWVHYGDETSLEEIAKPEDIIDETYTGKLGDAVRAFIDALPSELFWDNDAEILMDKEPEAYEEDGETYEPYWDEIYKLDRKDIVTALFGSFFAREFS